MIDRSFYDLVCVQSSDFTPIVEGLVRREVMESIGSSVRAMFPEFSKAFPETVTAMELHYSIPFLLLKEASIGCAYFLASEGERYNLFFDLVSVSSKVNGEFFDEVHSMLPSGWVELYRYFYSFVITADEIKPLSWKNTPFSYGGRLSTDRYRQLCGVKKSVVRQFEERLGSNRLYCWMLTDCGDALFLDEMRCDKKVYHVKDGNFEDCWVVDDPETVLDKYLAHFVATSSSGGFNFRK